MPVKLISIAALLALHGALHAQGNGDAFIARIPGSSIPSTVNLSVANAAGSPGQTVQVPIDLTTAGAGVPGSFQLDLAFDAARLRFLSVQGGAALVNAGKSLTASLLPNGNVRLMAGGSNQNGIASGVVASVTFTVSASIGGNPTVTPQNCISASGQGSALSTGCSAGTVTTTFTCDVTGDGAVNVADVQSVITQALGKAAAVGDLTHDGAVSIVDVQKAISAVLWKSCPY